jgi:hypothetical protein
VKFTSIEHLTRIGSFCCLWRWPSWLAPFLFFVCDTLTLINEEGLMNRFVIPALFILIVLGLPLFAENQAKGTLTVAGNAVKITQVYAYAEPGFFDKTKDDVVVLMCDTAVAPKAVRDQFERRDVVKAGKLHCVQQTIDAKGQVIQYRVEDSHFGMTPSGGSTYQVFEAKTNDGKTIAGRAHTTAEQKSFEDVVYAYDITISAAIEPKK